MTSAPVLGRPAATAVAAAAMAVVVGAALGFEHLGGFMPCAICLKERIPYYAGVPIMLLAAAAWAASRNREARALHAAGVLLMLVGAGMGVWHSGIEWRWWEGPSGCSAASALAVSGDLLASLDSVRPPSCTDAAGRFLGLSFAGWNVVASLACASVAAIPLSGRLSGGRARRRRSGDGARS